jgi:pyruvate/2-oxoglutarate dehydrogenase complex dihydrolipoamide acyltransferase (E2) component
MEDFRRRFVQQMTPYALEASRATGVDPRIIIAQAAIESGYGKSAPGQNYFGIKSHGRSGGQTLATSEYGDGGMYRTADSFRQYGSMADSAADYAKFINENKRYSGLRQAQGLDAQLAELQKSGYATDPNYSAKVGSIAQGINLLDGTAVDTAAAQAPAAASAPAAATPQKPVYSADLGTAARWLGNTIAPSLVDAPTPLTTEQAAQQKIDMAQRADMSKGAAGIASGLLQLAKLAQQPEEEERMPQMQINRGQFRPLPKMRGLLG